MGFRGLKVLDSFPVKVLKPNSGDSVGRVVCRLSPLPTLQEWKIERSVSLLQALELLSGKGLIEESEGDCHFYLRKSSTDYCCEKGLWFQLILLLCALLRIILRTSSEL